MLEYILVVSLAVLYCVFRWRHRRLYRLARALGEDPRSLPIIGVAHLFAGGRETLMKSLQSFGESLIKYQGIMSMWLGHHFFVVIADPILAEYVSKDCLEKDDIMKKCFKPALGNCNFNAPVPIWRVRRKNLVPLFKPSNLKQYVRIFAEQSNILTHNLRPSLHQPAEMFDYFMRYTLETIYQTMLGVELKNIQNTPHHPFAESLEEMTFLIGERCLKPWLQVDCLYKLTPAYKKFQKIMDFVNKTVDKILQSTKKRLMQEKTSTNQNPTAVRSIAEQLLNVGYSDEEMREEALSVAAAGVDTSAVTAGFVAAMLARHLRVQDKLHAELVEVFEKDELVTPDHLPRLKYLDAVIKETIRLFPPVPIVTRQTDKDCRLPSGVVVPAGCGILIHLWAINRHPQYWGPDADQFRPERFLDEGPEQPAQFASFSLGPRNCVGYKYALMSQKTLFATLLRRYRILPATESTSPEPRDDAARDEALRDDVLRDEALRDDATRHEAGRDDAPKLRAGHDIRLLYGITIKDVDNFTIKLEPRGCFD
ncbi:hypothetical protein O0L34_g8074 [Tuta absoluta]|nr:hypothetical protein O0L34_g8074 [Tuta absoluta]